MMRFARLAKDMAVADRESDATRELENGQTGLERVTYRQGPPRARPRSGKVEPPAIRRSTRSKLHTTSTTTRKIYTLIG